ncbi:hypothetical protein ACHAXT_008751 [Thalassiosira profunda]
MNEMGPQKQSVDSPGGDAGGAPAPSEPPVSTNTLVLDINALLNNEDVSDIDLIPEIHDDEHVESVPAVKAVLAARSPVFRRMLYGEFRETRSTSSGENVEVRLGYSGRVLELLVEFCFTDRLESLASRRGTPEEKARLLTNLSGAAHYFDIPKLEGDIQVQLDKMMQEHASLACAIVDESSRMLSGEELALMAMERIRARPKAALLHWESGLASGGASGPSSFAAPTGKFATAAWGEKGGVASLNASLLEQVIFDEQSTAGELTKFMCLQKWVKECKHEVMAEDAESPRKGRGTDEILSARTPQPPSSSPTSKSQTGEACADSQHELRLRIAKHLAEKLDLSLIPASDLSTTITDSRLISTHDLFQAYRLQALTAERGKSKIIVEGAGLAEVNGTYIQRGVHEGTPMYNKEGVWRDREEVFRIFLCTYSNGNKSWCLSVVPKGKEPGKTTDLDFYECPVSYGKSGSIAGSSYGGSAENGLGVVPSRGWKLVNYGQPPVPRCNQIAGCLED